MVGASFHSNPAARQLRTRTHRGRSNVVRAFPLRANGLSAVIACLFCACATSQLKRAPSAPDVAWKPASNDPHDFSLPADPSLPLHTEEAVHTEEIATTHPDRLYTLPDLIDIAESANPDTRI